MNNLKLKETQKTKTDCYGNLYFECYAYTSLCLFYDHNLMSLEKKERPDFQSKKLNIGLEVTRAMNEEDGRFYGAEHEFFYNKNMEIKPKYRATKDKDGQIILPKRELGIYKGIPYSSESVNFSDTLEKINNRIVDKTRLLNNGYQIFAQNWLYIITGDMEINLQPHIDKIFPKEIDANMAAKRFDVYFIDCVEQLYVIRGKNLEKIINIDTAKNKKLAKEQKIEIINELIAVECC